MTTGMQHWITCCHFSFQRTSSLLIPCFAVPAHVLLLSSEDPQATFPSGLHTNVGISFSFEAFPVMVQLDHFAALEIRGCPVSTAS